MLTELIQNNFVLIVNIVFLLVFLLTNSLFEKEITRLFIISLLLLIVITVAENMEYLLSFQETPSMLLTVTSITAYILRPLIIYVLILIFNFKSRKERIIVAIPAMINTVVEFSALFCGLAFAYDETNKFVRGPLGYTPHICGAIYVLLVLFLAIRFFKERNRMEASFILIIAIVCALATALESIWWYQGLLRGTICLSVTFFYLYFCAQSFKRDALTKVLNRHCFYRDAKKYKNTLTAVLSIDLNNLKRINDTEGHAAGDMAIITTSECVRKNLIHGSFLYRTGGDEFMVLCPKNVACMEQLMDMIERIYEDMKQTPYRCAIGIAEYRKGENFESLCARADDNMYQQKEEIKMQDLEY